MAREFNCPECGKNIYEQPTDGSAAPKGTGSLWAKIGAMGGPAVGIIVGLLCGILPIFILFSAIGAVICLIGIFNSKLSCPHCGWDSSTDGSRESLDEVNSKRLKSIGGFLVCSVLFVLLVVALIWMVYADLPPEQKRQLQKAFGSGKGGPARVDDQQTAPSKKPGPNTKPVVAQNVDIKELPTPELLKRYLLKRDRKEIWKLFMQRGVDDLDFWQSKVLEGSYNESKVAAGVLSELGPKATNAFPILEQKALGEGDLNTRKACLAAAASVNHKLAVATAGKLLGDKAKFIRRHAASVLTTLASQDQAGNVTAWVQVYQYRDGRKSAGLVLQKIGKDEPDELVKLLELDMDAGGRIEAAKLIENTLPAERRKALLTAYLLALKDSKNYRNRVWALEGMGKLSAEDLKPHLDIICMQISDRYSNVAKAAVPAIKKLGPAAVPLLTKHLGGKHHNGDLIQELLKDTNPAKQLPSLITELESKDTNKQVASIRMIQQLGPDCENIELAVMPLVSCTKSDDYTVRREAYNVLISLGPKAAPAIDELYKESLNKRSGDNAVKALCAIGKPALPQIIKALDTKDYGKLNILTDALQKMGAGAAPATEKLIETMFTRHRGREALIAIGKPAVPKLVDAWKDADRDKQREIIDIFEKIGPDSVDALPVLVAAFLKSNYDTERAFRAIGEPAAIALAKELPNVQKGREPKLSIIRALGRIGPPAIKTARPLYKLYLASKDHETRRHVVDALGCMGDGAAPPLLALLKKAKEQQDLYSFSSAFRRHGEKSITLVAKAYEPNRGDVGQRRVLLSILSEHAVKLPVASATLEQALVERDPQCWYSAAQGLLQADKPDALVPSLLKSLKAGDRQRKASAIDVLSRLKEKNEDVVKGLMAAARDRDETVSRDALRALGRCGTNGKPAIPLLCQAALNKKYQIRSNALSSIEGLAPVAEGAVPTLIKIAENPKNPGANTAIRILGRIGAPAEKAVPALLAIAKSKKNVYRTDAMQALAEIGADADRVVPVLIDFLAESDNHVVGTAIRTLGAYGPKAKAAIPALEKLTQNRNHDYAAKSALKMIRGK